MHLCCQVSYSVSTIALWGIRMPAITTGVKHFCWQYLVGCLWERKPFLGGKTALRRNPTESFRKNFKMTSRFSLREALLVSLVLVDRSFFFLHRVLLDIRYCWWQFNATRWRGETWPKRCWFLFCLNVAIWRLKRSSPIFFQTWVESKQTDKLRPTCTLDGRKLVGFESQGMVLCATSKDGKVEPHG